MRSCFTVINVDFISWCSYSRSAVHIDSYNNSLRGKALEISATDSRVRVFVIPTNEELVIARDTKELLDK